MTFKHKNNNNLFILILAVVIFIVLILFISKQKQFYVVGQEARTEEPKIDPRIYEEFKTNEWVPVLVRLKDKSGIEITGTKEEKIALSGQRDEWYKQKISEILAMLPPDQFKLTGKRFNGFSGEITKKGFEQLKENLAVKEITWVDTTTIISIN